MTAMLPENVPFRMMPDEVDAHIEFVTKLGVPDNDVRLIKTMIEGCMTEDHVAICERLVAFLPVQLAIRMLKSERHMIEVRPHLWGENQRAYLSARATVSEIGGLVMDMRGAAGEREAADGARAMRDHAAFLKGFLGQPTNSF